MKFRLLLATLLLLGSSSYAQNSDVKNIHEEDLIGRWIEEERYIGNSTENMLKNPLVYIFYDDMKFSRGEQSDGIVIFGVSGHYDVDNGYVKMWYRNYITENASSSKERTMYSKILSMTKDKAEVEVTESPYNSYRSIFRREH